MSLIDDFLFEPIEAWEQLPADIVLGDVAGIAVDSKDRIYLFNRGAHPVVVMNRDGGFLHAWGQGVFTNPHGASIGPDDSLYLTDNGDHTVRKFTPEGKLLLEIGVPGQPSSSMSNVPFCRCTHTALSPTGDIYVSDGYGNACVHKFSPDGKLLKTWGKPGTREGEFNLPHNICCDAAGLVYVADRENHRVQVFDGDGTYLRQINNLHRPCGLCITGGTKPHVLVGELGPYMAVNHATPNLGPRVMILDNDGTLINRLGTEKPGTTPGAFVAPHSVALDSQGDLYVGEVIANDWAAVFPGTPRPEKLRRMQKFKRIKS
jgi:DNA-binding beta-propeller fold protein YncE